jgi:hypothetical protein
MYLGLHVKYLLFLSDFNKASIFLTNFRKISKITFHENPCRGSRVVACGRTDMTNLIVALRNVHSAPKNKSIIGFYMVRSIKHLLTFRMSIALSRSEPTFH